MMLSNAVNIAAANLLHCVKHCAARRPIGISRKELSSICFDSSFCRIERIMFSQIKLPVFSPSTLSGRTLVHIGKTLSGDYK